jgi:hypothetical protein
MEILQELGELFTEYGDVFAMNNDDYGRTDRVYHSIDTGEAQQIRRLPRRIPVAKQAHVGEILEDMQRNYIFFLCQIRPFGLFPSRIILIL